MHRGYFVRKAEGDTKGWMGCGSVEKLKQMAGWFWKESIERNTVNLLAALLVSSHCLNKLAGLLVSVPALLS